MSDIYATPPQTKEQIREYLTSWLQELKDAKPLDIQGEFFLQEKGFRRAFCVHGVFRSLSTNEYVWFVCGDFDFSEKRFAQSKRYPTYEGMLEAVIQEYCTLWKIPYEN
jgi:hypothetical protein